MRLSVVIPTVGRVADLTRVLEAIEEQAGGVPGGVEVVVVDDGSTDGTKGLLEERAARGALVFASQDRRGPASARNRGAGLASGEILVFLGDDTVPEPGFLAAHDRAHREGDGGPLAVLGYTGWDEKRMSVTPFLVFLNEKGPQFGYGLIQNADDVPYAFFYTSNVSLPKAVFASLGGFDETFPGAAWEDVELAYRGSKATPALRLVYRPEARTRHHHPTTLESFRRRQRAVGKAGVVLARKHPELAEWVGALAARRAPARRPLASRLAGAAVALFDPLGIPLPERLYDTAIRWDYLAALREALSPFTP
ncbi:MAG TPA: glycosyltransferase [Thermoanaerobaculia bacterium]|nr:glycosyltransferase [Thermoanaerobaculia bacterium]